jgi:transcription elongation GreA/GreB family factor
MTSSERKFNQFRCPEFAESRLRGPGAWFGPSPIAARLSRSTSSLDALNGDSMKISERKAFFVSELKEHYRASISAASLTESRSGEEADGIRREARSKEEAKGAVEQGRFCSGQRRRRISAAKELESLVAFAASSLHEFAPSDRVGLGALVDVQIEDELGSEERTLFLLPVGAGTELRGPGGDGFIRVVSPASPVGRALSGSQVGDAFEIEIEGRDREWTVIDLC